MNKNTKVNCPFFSRVILKLNLNARVLDDVYPEAGGVILMMIVSLLVNVMLFFKV